MHVLKENYKFTNTNRKVTKMKNLLILILFLIGFKSIAQDRKILGFDLFEGTVDTLSIPDFDTTIVEEHTNYFKGFINNDFNCLSENIPTENIYEGVNFTKKKQASLDYDINKYPIRTSVKLFKWENDSLKSKCSGSMISRKHVLTAGHCVAYTNKDSLLNDSLFVSPVFDNGEYNINFESSRVKKVYIFENWTFHEDFSILELEKPIGENTGWISIGFNSDDLSIIDGIFYKFSYPAKYKPQIDPLEYNGDTLYYGYGQINLVQENSISVGGQASGIPGESGSSLIKIKKKQILY